MARGGSRTPRTPAPVSGPGALARRTDGGPGSKTQPLRAPTGGDYGDRKQTIDSQKAAPLPASDSPPVPSRGGAPAIPSRSVFGPSQRPGESGMAGIPGQPAAPTPPDPDAALRLLYSIFPHPQLLRLIRRS